MDIDSIIKYKKPSDSYYDILGCHQSSTIEQINREYKIRALRLHPDKNPDPESATKFQQLQIAKDVLSDAKKRSSYDTWLNSGIHIPFEQWEQRKGHSMHWAPARRTKLSLPGGKQADKNLEQQNNSTDSISKSVLEKFRDYEI